MIDYEAEIINWIQENGFFNLMLEEEIKSLAEYLEAKNGLAHTMCEGADNT